MKALNNEGFAIQPACASGNMLAVWSDDNASGGIALREAPLPCDPIAAPVAGSGLPVATVNPASVSPTTTAAAPPAPTPSSDTHGSGRSVWYIGLAVLVGAGAIAARLLRGRRRR